MSNYKMTFGTDRELKEVKGAMTRSEAIELLKSELEVGKAALDKGRVFF